MSILMLGISHKHAALPVRAAFAFSEEEQRGILEALKEKRIAEEAVLLCTCMGKTRLPNGRPFLS